MGIKINRMHETSIKVYGFSIFLLSVLEKKEEVLVTPSRMHNTNMIVHMLYHCAPFNTNMILLQSQFCVVLSVRSQLRDLQNAFLPHQISFLDRYLMISS